MRSAGEMLAVDEREIDDRWSAAMSNVEDGV